MRPEDRRAVADVCEREHARLVGILTLHTGDPWVAQELANDALTALCERWTRSPRIEDPRAWLTRVALNHADSWIRRRVAERRATARHGVPDEATAHRDDASAIAVRAAVAALPPRQREAVVLRYWGGCTAAEAGEAMGVAPATVRALAHQAVTSLREVFDLEIDQEDSRVH